jgi:hypothetical protein
MTFDRGEQRLRRRIEMKIRAEIDNQETIRPILSEKPQQPGVVAEHRPIDPAGTMSKNRVVAS